METLENNFKENSNHNSAVLKLGVISGLILVLISFILFFTDSSFKPWAGWISTVVMFCLIVFSQKILADGFDKITFGKVFGMGFKITLIIIVFTLVYFFIYTNFLESDYIEKAMVVARESLEKKGSLSAEQIDSAMEMSKKFMTPTFMALTLFIATLIKGCIFSLLGAAFFKKD